MALLNIFTSRTPMPDSPLSVLAEQGAVSRHLPGRRQPLERSGFQIKHASLIGGRRFLSRMRIIRRRLGRGKLFFRDGLLAGPILSPAPLAWKGFFPLLVSYGRVLGMVGILDLRFLLCALCRRLSGQSVLLDNRLALDSLLSAVSRGHAPDQRLSINGLR